MSVKDLGTTLTTSLLSEDPFLYAHLVKFERVPITASGQISESATDYAYVTDASFDIQFDDKSKNLAGISNGIQTYVANRLAKVSNITETTEAKVSSVNLTFSSIAIDSQFVPSATNRLTITSNGTSLSIHDTDQPSWLDLGFSEGDKIKITHNSDTSDSRHNTTAVIEKFQNNNYLITLKHSTLPSGNVDQTTNYTVSLDTDEVTAILYDPTSSTYNGYINREVSVYKAHIDPETGKVIGMTDATKRGGAYLLFKGIISKVKLSDDPTRTSNVTWTLTSHWGDFVRVNGRITSDAEHRALGGDGTPDIGALYRDDYAHDYGFMHGDTAINIVAIYQVQETRYKMKKSGLFGLKVKMKEYQVTVDKDVDLRLNLEAKRLPVIYGVQRTDSIPVFADSLHNDAGKIYVAYAICEGEISGLYDIYVDEQSRICIDKNDSDTRSSQTGEETIDVVCEGRMDRGDTLSAAPSIAAERSRGRGRNPVSFDPFSGGIIGGWAQWMDYYIYGDNTTAASNEPSAASGITHEKQTTLQYPINSKLVFHAGRSHQKSDSTLTRIAKAGIDDVTKGFKLQADFDDDKGAYWSQNHRLLDTAYVVAEYEIAEGDLEIPELDFVVRGREIEQYNYDYSYDQHPSPTFTSGTITDKRALFKIGDAVDFYRQDNVGSNNGRLQTGVQIEDSTTYYNARNEPIHKFRFNANPLGDDTPTEFYMVAADAAYNTDSRYPFITWDYKAHSGTVPETLFQTVTTTASDGNATIINTTTSGGTGVDFTELSTILQTLLAAIGTGLSVGVVLDTQAITDAVSTFLKAQANPSTSGGQTKDNDQFGTQQQKEKVNKYGLINAIKLASNASTTNDHYNGQFITVVSTDADGTQKRQSRKIVDYIGGSTKTAIVGDLIDAASPGTKRTGQTYKVTRGSWLTTNEKTLILDNITNLAVDDFVSNTDDGLASIEQGTKIKSIVTDASHANYRMITCDKQFRVQEGATLEFSVAGGADGKEIIPGDFDFVPQQGDTYEISAEGDKKVSINPAIQLLDYLTTARYGRGLDLAKDINLDTFKEAARLCDTRSNISLILPNSGTYTVGDKWKLVTTIDSVDYFQWQGTIHSVINANTGYKQVTFSNCIGKIAHKWFDWKTYSKGQVIYDKHTDATNKAYLFIADTPNTVDKPSGSGNLSSLSITKVGTSTSVAVHGVSSSGAPEAHSAERDNPIVKEWTGGDSYEKSGYNLYDCDDVKYWRYMGWQEHNQREVTRHQTNSLIRTDTPVFDNVNSLLEHFNGILRYSNGKYELAVETTTPPIPSGDVRLITDEDIIGAITVDDAGVKGSSNTVSVTIPDPNIRYDNRSVSFFKSQYLKEDNNIPKKKDVKTPLITSYYNARINAEQYLDQSRFSRKINFVMGPKGVLLVAGSIIKLTYDRFGWVNKEFRISNLAYRPDCSVQVTAQEHSDDTYLVRAKEKDYQSATGEVNTPYVTNPVIMPPSNLTAAGGTNEVTLSWVNTVEFRQGNNTRWQTEIWYNNHIDFDNKTAGTDFADGATHLDTVGSLTTWAHKIPNITADTTYYYWIRHAKSDQDGKQHWSVWQPLDSANGVSGTAVAGNVVTNTAWVYLYKAVGTDISDSTSQIRTADFPSLRVTMDTGQLHGQITAVTPGQDSDMTITSGQIINGAGQGTGWYTSTQSVTSTNSGLYRVEFDVSTSNTTADIAKTDWSLPKLVGSFGTVGDSGPRAIHGFVYYSTGQATSPGNPTASSYNFSTSAFTGLSSGWSLQAPTATPGATSSKYWYATFNVKEGITNQEGTGTTAGEGGSISFGTAYEGLNFTGLVTFTALSTDGSTTIHGGNITTGTINAARISLSGHAVETTANNAQSAANTAQLAANARNKTFYQPSTSTPTASLGGDIWVQSNISDVYSKYKIWNATTSNWDSMNPSLVGSWNLDSNSIFSGTKWTTTGFTTAAGQITLNSGGSIHTPKFFVDPDGTAGFKGVLTFTDGSLDMGNTTKASITNSAIELSDVSTNLVDKSPGEQVKTAFSTSTRITAGTILLQASSGSSTTDNDRVVISALSKRIEIWDGGNLRVKLGYLGT